MIYCKANYKIASLSDVRDRPEGWSKPCQTNQAPGLINHHIRLTLFDSPCHFATNAGGASNMMMGSFCNQLPFQYTLALFSVQCASINAMGTWSDIGIHFASFANYTINLFVKTRTFFSSRKSFSSQAEKEWGCHNKLLRQKHHICLCCSSM